MAYQRMSQFGYETDEAHDHDGPVRRAYGQAEELVRGHPGYSALATFGVGVAAGVAMALLFAPRQRTRSWYEDYLPEDFSAERMSRQVCEAVSNLLPGAVAQYFKKR